MIERVWSLAKDPEAPVHAVLDLQTDLSWCGSLPQERHKIREGSANAVTCVSCLLAIKRDQPSVRAAR